jgi:hypothetical protein
VNFGDLIPKKKKAGDLKLI